MRKLHFALTGRLPACLTLGCLMLVFASPPPARAQAQGAATPAPSAAAAGGGVQFADSALAPGDREMLARSAQLVGRWAMVQRVVQAVKAQAASPPPMERVQAIDQAWQRGEDPEGLATALAKNECAQALQTLMSANPGYGEAFVSDDRGALVCMTQRTSDYFQGDEEIWSRAWADGAGAVFVSANERDASTGLDLVHISVPIKSAGKVIGVLTVGKIASPPPAG